jgi:hypothetical protein
VSRALRLTELDARVQKVAAPYEKDIQSAVRALLSKHPAVERVFRINSGAHVAGTGESRRFIRFHDVPGMADLFVLLHPRHGTRFCFIEVKREGERPSEKQAAFLDMMRLRGHVAFVATSAQQAWNDLTSALSLGGADSA